MKLQNWLLMPLLCAFSACGDPLKVPNEGDNAVDAATEDAGPREICPENTKTCTYEPENTGRCLIFHFRGESHEECLGPGADGLIQVLKCTCSDCVNISYALLGGGEESCGDCKDRPNYDITSCPSEYEGE